MTEAERSYLVDPSNDDTVIWVDVKKGPEFSDAILGAVAEEVANIEAGGVFQEWAIELLG